MKIVNGSSLQPLTGNKPRQIVLLLHGFGSSGHDMIALATAWRPALPDALFLAPNAPQRSPMGLGYQWWGLSDLRPQALAAGAAAAAPALAAFIDRKLAHYDLTEADLVLVGFSQGTMMALHVGLHRAGRVAAVVGYSGLLAGAGELHCDEIAKPPVLLVHGSDDEVIPVTAMHVAQSTLRRLGVPVTSHVSRGVGHVADPVGLKLGRDFVVDALRPGR